ncbi:MAG TPA: glycosyltransferase [Bacteroidales bacterium]|nr:glycosyltransferase [Bacteroidales bacterium]
MTKANPTLDIAILTHNHKDFIKQCLESVLCQKTNYSFRIIVLDDCSYDGTSEILNDISITNPEIIELIINKQNIGPLESAIKLAAYVNAKYLCFLDGDDYWYNENKIQTQLDFLENNPDYAGCFHDAKIVQANQSEDAQFMKRTQDQWKTYSQFNKYSSDFMPWALIERNIIPTASLIFRNKDIVGFLKKYSASEFSLSWALHLEIIKGSKFKYFNETWSVYNDHPQGISKKYDIVDFKFNNIKILESLLLDKVWDYHKPEIYKSICNEYRLILKSKKELSKPLKDYKKSLKEYEKHLNLANKADLKQLKDDYYYVRDNGMVE